MAAAALEKNDDLRNGIRDTSSDNNPHNGAVIFHRLALKLEELLQTVRSYAASATGSGADNLRQYLKKAKT